ATTTCSVSSLRSTAAPLAAAESPRSNRAISSWLTRTSHTIVTSDRTRFSPTTPRSRATSKSAITRRSARSPRLISSAESMSTRIGVVGTGYLGRLHARVLTEMPEAEVAGFVEVNDSVAAEVAKTLGLRRFDSVPALAKAVDCAVVATPTTTHFDVACELIEAGCDVLVEKPITAEVDQGRRLI